MPYPWFEILDDDQNDLQQGDFIPDCPILIPPSNLSDDEVNDITINQIDTIILSQSCDLVNNKIEIVLVCPYYSLTSFLQKLPIDQQSTKSQKKVVDNLKKGYLPGYHLLDKDSNIDMLTNNQVVDFRNVYGVQFQSLLNLSESLTDRIRLLPPYREHLSQAFARYFMRVGLPQEISVDGY